MKRDEEVYNLDEVEDRKARVWKCPCCSSANPNRYPDDPKPATLIRCESCGWSYYAKYIVPIEAL